MTEDGASTAGEDRGKASSPAGKTPVADRVDTAVHTEQAIGLA